MNTLRSVDAVEVVGEPDGRYIGMGVGRTGSKESGLLKLMSKRMEPKRWAREETGTTRELKSAVLLDVRVGSSSVASRQ